MGCDKVRVFAGTRVADPDHGLPDDRRHSGRDVQAGGAEKVYLLLENEGSQNIATAQELADVMKLIPSKWVGFNWDPHNAYGKEKAYPEGYSLLPKERMLNLQIKGKGVMPESPEKEDWRAIFAALNNDGYEGKVGLETHLFDGTLITAAHKSMDEIMKIVARCTRLPMRLSNTEYSCLAAFRRLAFAIGSRYRASAASSHAARRPDRASGQDPQGAHRRSTTARRSWRRAHVRRRNRFPHDQSLATSCSKCAP